MEFKYGTPVFTSESKQAGSLHRIAIDPDSKQVAYLVILRGMILKEDKVIPVEQVATAVQEKIILDCTIEELHEMPPLELVLEQPVGGSSGRRQVVDPLVVGGAAWGPVPQPSETLETRRTIPEELTALKDGARVLSDDDDLVGIIECVTTAPDSRNVTHLTVSQGLLFKTRKYIPIHWVKMLGEDSVQLAVNAQQVEDLPAVEE